MLTKSPLVSVVMPVKECNPLFLKKSVESILNQTLTDLELIIVTENGDMSLEKSTTDPLKEFRNDKRLRVIHQKGKGFVEALNYGIHASRGKYIARMDADDISLPNRLKKQVEAVEKFHLDLVGGWAYIINETGLTIGKKAPPTDAHSIRRVIMLYNPFIHSTMLFKKSILEYSGHYNTALFGAEDYDLWLRIVSLGYAYANLPHYLILSRQTCNSVMRGKEWKKTRVNSTRTKALGLTRMGYYDPLSLVFCFVSPFSLIVIPRMASRVTFLFESLSNVSHY
jgi:glycosyltransferase involved in cell wall biosynthesis